MALRPTIYKFTIAVSDLDRGVYETLNLTVAQHPSETSERMMVRVLAFCLNIDTHLTFTKGLSTPDEPDVWLHSLDGQLLLWIDVGEPAFDRIKKATRIARTVKIYSFNSKSDVWWQQEQAAFSAVPVQVFQFPWSRITALAALLERTMDFSLTISENTFFINTNKGDVEVPCIALNASC